MDVIRPLTINIFSKVKLILRLKIRPYSRDHGIHNIKMNRDNLAADYLMLLTFRRQGMMGPHSRFRD